ncbi:MAG: magnesium-dependent phosphatase-1 [Planctomycetaceae bacterium]|nr:magnesium-dependent phosphatase-1 [Planctomycetaceae bacterium]
MSKLPRLVVFDLDFTLWDCDGTWCDCMSPPFSKLHGEPVDRNGRVVRLYDDVLSILDLCDQDSMQMALASRTNQPTWARELLGLLGITDRFHYEEIYPFRKLKHFAALQNKSGIDYRDMLFFDDEIRNITEVSTLGGTCIYVEDGTTSDVLQHGLSMFAKGR